MKSVLKKVLTACIVSAACVLPAQAYEKQKIRIAHFLPSTFAGADVEQWFVDQLKERSGGKITAEIYWAGAMGAADELLRLVQSGAVEVVAFPFSYYSKQFPLTHIGSVPNAFDTIDEAHEKFLKIVALPEVQEEHNKAGVTMLTSHFANPYRISCTKTTASLDAMKGYKARTVGEYMPKVYEALGLVPVNSPSNEVYEALDRRVLDCTYLSYDQMVASRIYEVAKFTNDMNLGAYATWQLWANKKWVDTMPEKNRALILEVAAEANSLDVEKAKEAARTAPAQLEAHGVTIEKLSPAGDYEAKAPSAVEMWKESMKKQGLEEAAAKITSIVDGN